MNISLQVYFSGSTFSTSNNQFQDSTPNPCILRKSLAAKERNLVIKDLTWVFDPAP